MRDRARDTSRRTKVGIASLLALSLLGAACGGASEGGKAGSKDKVDQGLTAKAGESGLADAGKPVRGGKLIYGLEADTNGGFCLSEGQLAISGMMVVRAVYDTLTVPNSEGEYVPYLAESVEPNSDFTEWTITLRPGIKFHDGSPLTASVVKNNLDAYRGVYPGRSSLLFAFVLRNIADIEVVDDLNLKVSTTAPWVAFPAFLFGNSRLGIMGQAQLDDKTSCARKLVGTGPFKFKSWNVNEKFEAVRNPDYWQTAPDGKPYPYADAIEFRPIADNQVRRQALETGDINVMHTSNADVIGNRWLPKSKSGEVNLFVSEDAAEVSFIQLNHTSPPFDDIRMRKAMAMGGNREEISQVINAGFSTIIDSPFSKDSIAYVKDPGFPKFDPEGAKKLVKEYVADGGKAEFTISSTNDPDVKRTAEQVQQSAKAVGVTVKIALRDQAALINDAIGKKYQAMLFRNYPGGDPDINYVWWYGGTTDANGTFSPNLVNFAGFNDKEVNRLLDAGRVETDPAKRKTIYQDLSRRMATEVHGIWSWLSTWAIVEAPEVHGVLGPPLPADDPAKAGTETTDDPARKPFTGLANGHSLLGLWISK